MREFRTDRRRMVTRKSGYNVDGVYSGGEARILRSDLTTMKSGQPLVFTRQNLELYEVFQASMGVVTFGGYIKSNKNALLDIEIDGIRSNNTNFNKSSRKINLVKDEWTMIGIHRELSYNPDIELDEAILTTESDDILLDILPIIKISLTIYDPEKTINNLRTIESDEFEIQFIGVDFDTLDFHYFKAQEALKHFKMKTNMFIPGIYYLDTSLPTTTYADPNQVFTEGDYIVFKGCNRCSRLLPIDVNNNENVLEFSRHCVKRAPCVHTGFNNFTISNSDELDVNPSSLPFVKNNKVFTHYGHQLECRSCKKFFVNAPLNPQRTPQQHKEDSLRRRSFEVLINNLLDRNLGHLEFKNKIGLNQYIWEKFGGKCFKCDKKIPLNEMHLDHTMPLAYLYRLDETATCLCAEHNLQKSDSFPVDYYSSSELEELIKITGLDPSVAKSRTINMEIVKKLEENISWFFDIFLMDKDYHRKVDGKWVSRLIYSNLNKVLRSSGFEDNYLLDLYIKEFDAMPESINK